MQTTRMSTADAIVRFLCAQYMRRDGVEAAWQWVMPILDQWQQSGTPYLPEYRAGTWGPLEANRLIEADGRHWRTL